MLTTVGVQLLGSPAGASGSRAGQAAASVPVRAVKPSPLPVSSFTSFRRIDLPSQRQYVLHAAARNTLTAAPLVIVLHAWKNSWSMANQQGGWSTYADAHGFVVAYGIGLYESWNAGTCCGKAVENEVDDVEYLADLVADVTRRLPVDRARVYLAGFSNGEMLALRAQCERPDLFAASGGSGGALVAPCRAPFTQIRERHLHGTLDTLVPFDGGYSSYTGTSFPAAADMAEDIAEHSPGPAVGFTPLPCQHLWPRRDNACRYDGTDAVWTWMSQWTRPVLARVPGVGKPVGQR